MKSNNELKEIDIKNRTCYCFDDIIKMEDFYFDKMKNHTKIFWLMTFHTKYS